MAELMKNATPRAVTQLVSILIGGFVFIVLLVFKLFFFNTLPLWIILSLPVLSLAFSYVLVYYLLNKFLYRKIKLIYKTIYDAKIPEK